jgi:hypothetical protein
MVDAMREQLRKNLPRVFSYSEEEKRRNVTGYCTQELPWSYSTFLKSFADSIIASILAISYRASLVVPIVVMVFNPFINKSLITTSIAVVTFAFFLGF